MDKSLCFSIVWSSLIICKFQVYTGSTPYPKLFLGILHHLHIRKLPILGYPLLDGRQSAPV